MHGYWVPYSILTKQRYGVAFFEAVVFNQSGGEVGRDFFDLFPVQCLLGDCVVVTGELVFGEAGEGGVVGVFEEPLPGC